MLIGFYHSELNGPFYKDELFKIRSNETAFDDCPELVESYKSKPLTLGDLYSFMKQYNDCQRKQ